MLGSVVAGDASGRFRRGKDVFIGQIQRWPVPLRQFHLHSGHRLQGEGTAVPAVAIAQSVIPAATTVDYHFHSHMIISLSTLQSFSLTVGMLLITVLLYCYLK
jgi:hypothetical protein